MGIVHTSSANRSQYREPAPLQYQRQPSSDDADAEIDVVALLEENARLRSLVVQLSDLVLRNVLEK
jgi:hypothetical protein